MSTPNNTAAESTAERVLRLLELANTATPIVAGGISALVSLFKKGGTTGKTDEEITAEWNDSMGTAQRTKAKSEDQMSDRA